MLMKRTTILGVILLIIVLTGIFIGLHFAYTNVGQAVKFAETKGNIKVCSVDKDCPETKKCVDGFCRSFSPS